MSSTDVLMFYPKTGFDVGGAIAPPFSSMFATAYLHENGYNIKIIDQRVDDNWEKSLDKEIKRNPKCIGFTTMTGSQIKFALEAAKYIKNKTNVPFVWGGPHPTILPEQTLKNEYVDIVVKGEGEESFFELFKAIDKEKSLKKVDGISFKDHNHKIIHNKERRFMNVENIPNIPWELIDVKKYIYKSFYIRDSPKTLDIGETSRGCPNRCTFCCNSAIKKNFWRGMSAEKSAQRIKDAVEKFKLTGIWIRDDSFYVNIKRVEEICKNITNLDIKWYTAGTTIPLFNKIDNRTMKIIKKSGCDCVKFGGESGNNETLRNIRKNQSRQDIIRSNLKCKKYDIISSYAFMVGFPNETYKEMLDTVSVMKQIKKDYPNSIIDALNMVTPHYGTELYDQIKSKYNIKEPKKTEEWSVYAFEGDNQQIWFNKKLRKKIQNMSDISVYMENVSRLFNSIENPTKRIILKTAMYPWKKYYQFKWKHNLFGYDPTLKLMRIIRNLWLDF